jgi:hypothetical protein
VIGNGVEPDPVAKLMSGVDGVNIVDINGIVCWKGCVSVNGPRETSNPRCTVLSLVISFNIPFEYTWVVILSYGRSEET